MPIYREMSSGRRSASVSYTHLVPRVAAMTASVSFLDMPVFSATAAISSVLFMIVLPDVYKRQP